MARQPRRAVGSEASRLTEEAGWPDWADAVAVQRLREPLRSGRLGHAYLLAGPKGVGKAALARAFAEAVCCTADRSDPSQPCGTCRACRDVARGAHADVETYSVASQALVGEAGKRGTGISIESVRQLRSSASLKPIESQRRILIVDDAETMLEPAQQALLKTLEEPPAAVVVLLLADEAERLLETVRSRCQLVPVRPTGDASIVRALTERGVDSQVAVEIAGMSRGCAGWAIAAAADDTILASRRQEWESALAWTKAPHYDRLVTAYRLGEQFSKRGPEVIGIVQAAIQILHQELVKLVSAPEPGAPSPSQELRGSAGPLALTRAIRSSLQCLADLDANVRPRLALEAMVLAWPTSTQRDS